MRRVTFERNVAGLAIYRDPDNLEPREIFYGASQAADSVYIGSEVDIEALAFDLGLSDWDREFLAAVKVLD